MLLGGACTGPEEILNLCMRQLICFGTLISPQITLHNRTPVYCKRTLHLFDVLTVNLLYFCMYCIIFWITHNCVLVIVIDAVSVYPWTRINKNRNNLKNLNETGRRLNKFGGSRLVHLLSKIKYEIMCAMRRIICSSANAAEWKMHIKIHWSAGRWGARLYRLE